ncbi:WD repeat-containing protein 5 [Venturia inaequalis]|uniref:Uncharacterized protein n=1 Tax=Venturia inaequalis TaxID=5025 RepID=A0A8H3ZCR2_VENIN|nr:hypothetical protein EG327_003029 [Venturia inaequalis]RDI81751.1 WD repeat-containing protein 5 [Venturia inaequalis]
MHLQTLLPAILFAHSSFASYYCCFEIAPEEPALRYAHFHLSGGSETLLLSPGCAIKITKTGKDCSKWQSRILANGCPYLSPMTSIGVAPESHCHHPGTGSGGSGGSSPRVGSGGSGPGIGSGGSAPGVGSGGSGKR